MINAEQTEVVAAAGGAGEVDLQSASQSVEQGRMQKLEPAIKLGDYTLLEAAIPQPDDITSLYSARNAAGEVVLVELLHPVWALDADCISGLAAYAHQNGLATIETDGRFGIVHVEKQPGEIGHLTIDILLEAAGLSNED